ncbi:MAG: hypothetical protein ACK4MX_11250, partial [Thermaurantiacus sp.]
MIKVSVSLLAATALSLGLGGAANASAALGFESNNPMAPAFGPRTASGGSGDLTWVAQSLIVGMTPTAGGAAPRFPGPGDDPIFHGSPSKYSGVVPIIMD